MAILDRRDYGSLIKYEQINIIIREQFSDRSHWKFPVKEGEKSKENKCIELPEGK